MEQHLSDEEKEGQGPWRSNKRLCPCEMETGALCRASDGLAAFPSKPTCGAVGGFKVETSGCDVWRQVVRLGGVQSFRRVVRGGCRDSKY